jgi:hypothetical protein
MNITNILYIFDVQKDDTKEFQWDEGTTLYTRTYHLA